MFNRQLKLLSRIQPRPQTVYCSQGRAVLATDRDGLIDDFPKHGLFYDETRILSRYLYLINGRQPQHVVVSNVEQHSWLGYYIFSPPGAKRERDSGSGEVEPSSQQTIEMRVSRTVGLGIHEDIDFTNFTQRATKFAFEIELDADFADQAETSKRKQKGKLVHRWTSLSARCAELSYDYQASHRYSHQGNRGVARIHRGLIIRVENAGSAVTYRNRRLRFEVSLQPCKSWHACIKFTPVFEGKLKPPLYRCREFFGAQNELERKHAIFLNESTHFQTTKQPGLTAVVETALDQAKHDLAALRLPDLDRGDRAWIPAAGLPIYIALFGRDSLTAAWQTAISSPAMLEGVLYELPKWQGKVVNDWRDEEPGRMLHEAHAGPLASLFYNPRTRYYGSAATSTFYPIVVSELWHWTGDENLVKPLLAPALRGLEWQDKYTHFLGDSFYGYKTHSKQGNRNQGWKDSGDAIVYEDGSQVYPPICTCEEQGFVYVARLRLAEMLWFIGDRDLARRLFRQASELKKKFSEAFWMPDKNFCALGLDSKGHQIKSIASNPGHLLTAGIISKDEAKAIATRLLQPDMFSGWGIRTLSSEHPAYDPYSYHRGTVWPVEHASIAMGLMRFGLFDELHTIARAIFEASTLFDFYRLPECFSGHQRDNDHPFPALYPKTNWPQAWSASSLFTIVQAILGLYPFAPKNVLLVDPHLPEWLPEITLRNLHVGEAVVDLRFYRKRERTHFQVLDLRGKLHILRQPSPWSVIAGLGERIEDVIESLAA